MLMWQEVIHRLDANKERQEVKIKKNELYTHALVQDVLIWAIMSPEAAAAAAEARHKSTAVAEEELGVTENRKSRKSEGSVKDIKLSMS